MADLREAPCSGLSICRQTLPSGPCQEGVMQTPCSLRPTDWSYLFSVEG